MEILQLRYFYESAKNESFAKTAQKYRVPLSSVSASVKRLETELGCTLFDRHKNRIVLNENGKTLQNSLCMIFDELHHVTQTLSPQTPETKEIKISVRALRNEITDHIIEYAALHPQSIFKTFFDFGETDFESYDIIIGDDPEKYPGFDYFEFTSKRILLKTSKSHPLCGKKLHLKDLWNQPFISMGEHTSTHKMLTDACKKEGFTPNFIVHTNDLLCYNKYVQAGVGIGIGRYHPDEPANRNIVNLDVIDFIARQTVYVFYKNQSAHGNIKAFLDFLQSKVTY